LSPVRLEAGAVRGTRQEPRAGGDIGVLADRDRGRDHDASPSARAAATRRIRTAARPATNVLNPGQMLLWHVTLLPVAVGVITVMHVVLVRRHGVVPPLDDEREVVSR
jgi:hypothetical protein